MTRLPILPIDLVAVALFAVVGITVAFFGMAEAERLNRLARFVGLLLWRLRIVWIVTLFAVIGALLLRDTECRGLAEISKADCSSLNLFSGAALGAWAGLATVVFGIEVVQGIYGSVRDYLSEVWQDSDPRKKKDEQI